MTSTADLKTESQDVHKFKIPMATHINQGFKFRGFKVFRI